MPMHFLRIAGVITLGMSMSILAGCVNGNRQLAEMTAHDIHEKFQVGKTSVDEVRQTLGEPQEKGIDQDVILWHYRYQKLSAAAFVPIMNLFAKDASLRGYLRIAFENELIKDVDYYGSK